MAENLKSLLNTIQENKNDFEYMLLNDGVDKTKEHYLKVRNNINLRTELLMKDIQDKTDELLKEVNVSEIETLKIHINRDKE